MVDHYTIFYLMGVLLNNWHVCNFMVIATAERIYNPIMAMGFWQCLPFIWTTLRGKHCRHPIAVMGVVDMLGQ